MKVFIRLFAALREQLGYAERMLELPEGARARDAWQALGAVAEPGGGAAPVLVARNQAYVDWDAELADGDEVAFFPPVTGG